MIRVHLSLEPQHSLKIPIFGHGEDNSENIPQDTFDETSLHND